MKKVNIVPYNSNWPIIFEELSFKIKNSLGDNIRSIYHIGSTSVNNLASKNKIDIGLVVKNANDAIKKLEEIGFEYRGEWNIPFKYGFRYRHDIKANLHMFDFFYPAIESNLLFRDHLRNHKDDREKYEKLKYEIIKDESAHKKNHPFLYNYTVSKSSFIKKIIKKTGFDKVYLQYCCDLEEMKFANDCRVKKNLKPIAKDEFFKKNHKHFILQKGVNIIGYAHLEILSEHNISDSKYILHTMIFGEIKMSKNYQQKFQELIDSWVNEKL